MARYSADAAQRTLAVSLERLRECRLQFGPSDARGRSAVSPSSSQPTPPASKQAAIREIRLATTRVASVQNQHTESRAQATATAVDSKKIGKVWRLLARAHPTTSRR